MGPNPDRNRERAIEEYGRGRDEKLVAEADRRRAARDARRAGGGGALRRALRRLRAALRTEDPTPPAG